MNNNGVLDQCDPCTDNAFCDDSEPCSFDRCIDNVCRYDMDTRYGDVAGNAGLCRPDGDVNLSDILAVLEGFTGQYAGGVRTSTSPVTREVASPTIRST